MPLIINTKGKLVNVTYTSEERLLLAFKSLVNLHDKKVKENLAKIEARKGR